VLPWVCPPEEATVDVLSDILSATKLVGSLYFTTDFTPPWGVRVGAYKRVARFHVVLRGECWVDTPDGVGPTRLDRGDIILVLRGAAHTLADGPETECKDLERVIEDTGFRGEWPLTLDGAGSDGAGAPPTRLLCGHFEFDGSIDHPLLTQLPPRIVVRAEDGAELDTLIRFIAREIHDHRAGREAVLQRLSEVLFIQAVRSWSASGETEGGMLAALADVQVGRGLSLIHADPGRPWSLPGLAREAGLSRTGFAERFRDLVGMTPMQYLAFWRMQKAREMFRQGSPTVEAVAAAVGYESLPAFSRAFKRWVGQPPGAYRRRLARVPHP